MSDDSAWTAMTAKLKAAGQDHVLTPPPAAERKASFLQQLQSLDLDGLPRMLQTSLNADVSKREVEPFTAEALSELSDSAVAACRQVGLEVIAKGQVAALLLAGGQGTRLGTSAPKGCYDIGLLSGKSLFQYHAERLRKVKQLAAALTAKTEAEVRLPLLIMTSDATDAATRDFFETHKHFGLPPDEVLFFQQGMLPCLTPEGKLLLDSPGQLAMAPNGNGGVYVSLRDSALDSLTEWGTTSVFQFGVDNILCHVADPTFIGYCLSKGADCASKTVAKSHAHEPVGALAQVDGAPAVVEYSEISAVCTEITLHIVSRRLLLMTAGTFHRRWPSRPARRAASPTARRTSASTTSQPPSSATSAKRSSTPCRCMSRARR